MVSLLLAIFVSSFMVTLSGALMPGPLLTVTVTESSTRGATAGPLMIFGHGVLELLLVVALLGGLGSILTRDDVFVGISLAGAATLCWMAFSMVKSLPTLTLKVAPGGESQRNLVVAGIVLSAVNPYWSIWWASIGVGYITHSMHYGVLGVATFFAGHLLADLAWYAFVSYGVARGRHLLTDTRYRVLIGGCALFLVLFSCYFLYSGVSRARLLI